MSIRVPSRSSVPSRLRFRKSYTLALVVPSLTVICHLLEIVWSSLRALASWVLDDLYEYNTRFSTRILYFFFEFFTDTLLFIWLFIWLSVTRQEFSVLVTYSYSSVGAFPNSSRAIALVPSFDAYAPNLNSVKVKLLCRVCLALLCFPCVFIWVFSSCKNSKALETS